MGKLYYVRAHKVALLRRSRNHKRSPREKDEGLAVKSHLGNSTRVPAFLVDDLPVIFMKLFDQRRSVQSRSVQFRGFHDSVGGKRQEDALGAKECRDTSDGLSDGDRRHPADFE